PDLDAAPVISRICGDGIRGLDEECDDGNASDSDFCTRSCRVRDALFFPADNTDFPARKKRGVSRGYHPVAGNERTAAFVFADTTDSPNELRVALVRPDGSKISGDSGIPFGETR